MAVEHHAARRTGPVLLRRLYSRTAHSVARVGIVAIVLPFAVAIPYLIVTHKLETSISVSYYTFMRNFSSAAFAPSRCYVLLPGYDKDDVRASHLASLLAIGVAFFPCQRPYIKYVHYVCATALFLDSRLFLLVLFRRSHGEKTPRKKQRNKLYRWCGAGILLSMGILLINVVLGKSDHPSITRFSHPFCL